MPNAAVDGDLIHRLLIVRLNLRSKLLSETVTHFSQFCRCYVCGRRKLNGCANFLEFRKLDYKTTQQLFSGLLVYIAVDSDYSMQCHAQTKCRVVVGTSAYSARFSNEVLSSAIISLPLKGSSRRISPDYPLTAEGRVEEV